MSFFIFQKFERIYYNQLNSGSASKEAEFEYSWCLVRSKYPADIRKGIMILEQLYTKYVNERRDYLYYLALGNARLKVSLIFPTDMFLTETFF